MAVACCLTILSPLIIRAENLVKRYGSKLVLNGVTIEFSAGEVVAIVGVNGVGKTTLLKCLSYFKLPTSGQVWVGGEELKRGRIDLRRRLAYLPGIPEMNFGTPLAYIGTMAAAYGLYHFPDLPDRVVELLEHFEVHDLAWTRWEFGSCVKPPNGGIVVLSFRRKSWRSQRSF